MAASRQTIGSLENGRYNLSILLGSLLGSGALMVAYALMNADLAVILMLVGAYLLIVACCIGFTVHYNKTM